MSCYVTATVCASPLASRAPLLALNSRTQGPMSIPATAFQRPPTGRRSSAVPVQASLEPKPDKLMRAVALMLFTYVWRLQDAFPILGKAQLAAIALLAALLYFAGTKQAVRRVRLIQGPTTKLVTTLVVIMMIGVPFSLW